MGWQSCHYHRRLWKALTLLSAPIPAQLPLRGFAGHWISRLSECGWRSPRRSASCKTGPSTPGAPRAWEQVMPQTGPQFCQSPALLWGDSQRQEVGCKLLLSWGGREKGQEGGGSVPLWLISQSCLAQPPRVLKPGARAGWRGGAAPIHCCFGALEDACPSWV